MIFVGTKKQAIDSVKEAAESCGQFYVTKRWLGGTLTNFQTVKSSIDRLRKIDRMRENGELEYFSKKERSQIEKEYTRLNDYLFGIREMKEPPQAMFVVDLNKEHIAVAEAKRLSIPVVGIADTNADPDIVDYPIPGNDDAIRSIKLFSKMCADAYNEGLKEWEIKKRENEEQEVEETKRPEEQASQAKAASAEGPAVVKVSKGRKLVAAGTAEEVEIEMELDAGESPATPNEAASEDATASTGSAEDDKESAEGDKK